MITIVEHDPGWPRTFGELRSTYEAALEGVPVLAIEHVGSTAVEGLAAKPVIDIDVVVSSADVGATVDALGSIGFLPLGEQGVPGRWALQQPEDLPRTHTYVVEEGSLALRNHLAVRDALRTDPDLRDSYARLKRELATTSVDADAYVSGKSPLLLGILGRAGFTDDELTAIERANRIG